MEHVPLAILVPTFQHYIYTSMENSVIALLHDVVLYHFSHVLLSHLFFNFLCFTSSQLRSAPPQRFLPISAGMFSILAGGEGPPKLARLYVCPPKYFWDGHFGMEQRFVQ
jgi:hypothetical protein